ncbi:MAG: hypothetical protein NTZ89_00725, partial [Actinobacteria bacterium]|nr:hypothetical protein [Actinomycetota bacterium]
DITEIKRGMDTGKNDEYLFQKPDARGNYVDITPYQDKIISPEEAKASAVSLSTFSSMTFVSAIIFLPHLL